jgi:3-oxoacyl-[acyl-carrier-protein] synthase II
VEQVWAELLRGSSAICPVTHFTTQNYITKFAAVVPGLSAPVGQSRLYPLLEQLLSQLVEIPAQARLITASTKGAIDVLENSCRHQQPVQDITSAVTLGSMTTWVQQRLGLDFGGININAACTSATLAIARAAAYIAHGSAEVVVVCCADLVSEFVFSGFSALQALAVNPSRPFDVARSGLTLGEGAAAVVLMSDAAAQKYGRKKLAQVCGWGAANDANHITAPARDGCGLIKTVHQALRSANVQADDVAAISAHGTGTVYNDMMELTAFAAVFGASTRPISSVKGALGHTLGAAGGIETVLAVKSLETGVLPPTCALVNPEPLARGQVSNLAQPFSGDIVLSTNSGFGGVNAALLFKREQGL